MIFSSVAAKRLMDDPKTIRPYLTAAKEVLQVTALAHPVLGIVMPSATHAHVFRGAVSLGFSMVGASVVKESMKRDDSTFVEMWARHHRRSKVLKVWIRRQQAAEQALIEEQLAAEATPEPEPDT